MINACLRYYMHVADPNALSDGEWASLYDELCRIRQAESKAMGGG